MKLSKVRLSIFFLALALVCDLQTAMAQEDHAAAAHASGGLPQFDPYWWPSQIFWMVITFTILYVTVARRVLPEISSVLDNRRNQVEGDLTTAERMKAEAEAAQQAYESGLQEARQNASILIGGAHDDLKNSMDEETRLFRTRIEGEIAALEQRLDSMKAAAMNDMTMIAADIASEAARKIVGISTDPEHARGVVSAINNKRAA